MSISVVIPCYNSAPFIGQAIESVLHQTAGVGEILVVDDGSTDASGDIARNFGSLVRVVWQSNQGESVARNRGISEAGGDFIALLDADDLWRPEKVERQLSYLHHHSDVGAVACRVSVLENGRCARVEGTSDAVLRKLTPYDFLAIYRVVPSTLLIRAEIARLTRFPQDVSHGEDVIYGAMLRRQCVIGSIDEPLAIYRRHAQQQSQQVQHFSKSVDARLRWASRHFRLLGADGPEEPQQAVLAAAVSSVMDNYWARDFAGFRVMRRQLLSVWPQDYPLPAQVQRWCPPAFLARLKDRADTILRGGGGA